MHKLIALRRLAELNVAGHAALDEKWAVVKDWTEEARYEGRSQRQAEEILAAIRDPLNGVLQWLKEHW